MSEPCLEECRAEGFSLITSQWLQEYGIYPNDEDLQEEYRELCESWKWEGQ